MSFQSMDFAYHRVVDNKFTYTLNWTQILLILCKRPNKVYLIKMLKHLAQTSFGTKMGLYVFCLWLRHMIYFRRLNFLRLVHNILKKRSQRDIVLIWCIYRTCGCISNHRWWSYHKLSPAFTISRFLRLMPLPKTTSTPLPLNRLTSHSLYSWTKGQKVAQT